MTLLIGHTIAYNNKYWADVYHNLWKARQCWGMISKVLTKTGAMVWAHGMIYKAVAQTVLIYRRGSWAVTREMMKVMEGFHHRESRRIAEMVACCMEDAEWDYPPVVDVLEDAGICPIKE